MPDLALSSSWPTSPNPPNGTIRSNRAGQLYVDFNNGRAYVSTLANNLLNWQRLQVGELVSNNNAAVFANDEAVTQSL